MFVNPADEKKLNNTIKPAETKIHPTMVLTTMKFILTLTALLLSPMPMLHAAESPTRADVLPEDRDRMLFDVLELGREELRAVKVALDRSDLAQAKAALVTHFRTRAKPVGPELSPDGSASGLRAANEICDHVFRFTGCPPTKLELGIRWNEDPHHYDQWAIALNRHFHWVTLGRAYAATKDEKYAREFVTELNNWVQAMPVRIGSHFLEGPFLEHGRTPLSLDAGIRMAQTWWPAYYYFKDSPSFDVEAQFRMLRSFYDHARYLMDLRTFHVGSNWGAMEGAGLIHLAVMLPEFKEAPHWLRTACARAVEVQKAQVYPDGAQIELTPGYHWVTLVNFLSMLDVTRRNDVKLPVTFRESLEKMFEYFVAIAMPDGNTPALNDSGWQPVKPPLQMGLALFPKRTDFEFFASDRKRGTAPAQTSWALTNAGWFVMRTGWNPDDRYLFFDAGPFGAAHQHEDKLNLVVHVGGRTILTEGGNYSYDSSDWRRYVLSTRAHNTVMVDGLEQNRSKKPETWVVWNPGKYRWQTDSDFDFAEGCYDSGYGPSNAVRVTHTRQVVFAKPDYWLVLDTMTPADNREHCYEAIFHLDAEDAVVDPVTKCVSVEYGGNGFRIQPLRADGMAIEIIKAQKQPVVQGWLPTGRHNELKPIPTAVYRWTARGPIVIAFALEPRRMREPWPIASVTSPATRDGIGMVADILRADGGRDVLEQQADLAVSLVCHNVMGGHKKILRIAPMRD